MGSLTVNYVGITSKYIKFDYNPSAWVAAQNVRENYGLAILQIIFFHITYPQARPT